MRGFWAAVGHLRQHLSNDLQLVPMLPYAAKRKIVGTRVRFFDAIHVSRASGADLQRR